MNRRNHSLESNFAIPYCISPLPQDSDPCDIAPGFSLETVEGCEILRNTVNFHGITDESAHQLAIWDFFQRLPRWSSAILQESLWDF